MSFNADLTRKGPGLLVRDLMKGKDPQIAAIVDQIVDLKPDILALQSVDYDYAGVAAQLIKEALDEAGHSMPHHFQKQPNTGVLTDFDLDRNGRYGEARDAQGYGFFTGQGGLLLLSRFPIETAAAHDFSAMLWKDKTDANVPLLNGAPYFTPEEYEVLRLHTVAAWQVPVTTPHGKLSVLMSQAGPPVFDGPENRNGLRNADEIGFWHDWIGAAEETAFVLMAGLNNDPVDGEGDKPALRELLNNPRLQDPRPANEAGSTDTVDWKFDDLRVDYVLPSADLLVVGSGVHWPTAIPEEGFGTRHRAVWVDVLWE